MMAASHLYGASCMSVGFNATLDGGMAESLGFANNNVHLIAAAEVSSTAVPPDRLLRSTSWWFVGRPCQSETPPYVRPRQLRCQCCLTPSATPTRGEREIKDLEEKKYLNRYRARKGLDYTFITTTNERGEGREAWETPWKRLGNDLNTP